MDPSIGQSCEQNTGQDYSGKGQYERVARSVQYLEGTGAKLAGDRSRLNLGRGRERGGASS